jgi:hypothetical protein
VAREFLKRRKLVSGPAKRPHRIDQLALAVHPDDQLASLVTRATRAVRTVYPERPVDVQRSEDPIRRVYEGHARLAVLGSERFFTREEGQPPRREERVEAIAVLGTRMVHLVRRVGEPEGTPPLSGRIGVGKRGSGRNKVAAALLAITDTEAAEHAAPGQLMRQVAGDKLDAALIVAEPGDEDVVRGLAGGKLRLLPLGHDNSATSDASGWLKPEKALQIPFLRRTRIPGDTYSGQSGAVATLGAQVVLAGPAPARSGLLTSGGPAAALPSHGSPVPRKEVEALAKATRVPETPDPALPSAWALHIPGRDAPEEKVDAKSDLFDTALNLMAIIFLCWLGSLIARRETPASED